MLSGGHLFFFDIKKFGLKEECDKLSKYVCLGELSFEHKNLIIFNRFLM